MRNEYINYYPPTKGDLDRLWSTGLVVVDTNALLNLYRYRSETRDEFLTTLRALQDRLWLPFWVGLEFHRGRPGVIYEEQEAYDSVSKAVTQAEKELMEVLGKHREHSSLPATKSMSLLKGSFHEVRTLIYQALQTQKETLRPSEFDSVWEELSAIFEGRVGERFSEEELKEIYNDGAVRYEKRVPPGYGDAATKPEPDRYGDLVIWKEILRHAKANSADLIFITDDSKEDWWRKTKGKIVGPRVELLEEYRRETGGRAHFYKPLRFLQFAKDRGLAKVSDSSLREVERVSNIEQSIESLLDGRQMILSEIATLKRDVNQDDSNYQSILRDEMMLEEKSRELQQQIDEHEAAFPDDGKAPPYRTDRELLAHHRDYLRSLTATERKRMELDDVHARLDETRSQRTNKRHQIASADARLYSLGVSLASIERDLEFLRSGRN